ncbi:hypothetical protein M3Y96_00392900 [Aphelenchoides besseyi]|nr:hypothetical protein M3Y96_00392900 [Aphelenchoides besseyi]
MIILLFYLTFYLNVYGNAQEVYIVAASQGSFIIKVGTPEQRLLSKLSWEISEMILVDINCGVHSECAAFCKDTFFASAYCSQACQPIHYASESLTKCEYSSYWDVYHNIRNFDKFYPMNSSSIEFRQTKWSKWISGFAPFYGQIVRDQLSIQTNPNSDGKSTSELSVQLEMIDTLLVVSNFMLLTTSVIGLAPGKENIVSQMYANDVIPQPVVSIYAVNEDNGALTFGAYNQQNCTHWTHHKTVGNRWILNVNNIEVNGFQYAVKSKVLFSLHTEYIYMPSNYLDFLVQSNVLIKWNDEGELTSQYVYNCNQHLELNTMIDGQPIRLDERILKFYPINESLCNAQIQAITVIRPKKRYLYDVDFVFGSPFAYKYCVAFDYQLNNVGLFN